MKNSHSLAGNDATLISRVKVNEDRSVQLLFYKYLPLVKTFYKTYSVRNLDFDDWKQESLIVMLKCARRYHIGGKYRFSTLYRAGLRNRFVDLIRKQSAQRRVPTNILTSFEANEILYANTLKDSRAACPEKSILVKEILKRVFRNCSPFERKTLRGIVKQHPEEIALKNKCSLSKIRDAFERCKRKYRKIRTARSN